MPTNSLPGMVSGMVSVGVPSLGMWHNYSGLEGH